MAKQVDQFLSRQLLPAGTPLLQRALSLLFPVEDIPSRADPTKLYLRRYHVLSEKIRFFSWLRWFRIYLHCFYRSDEDPDPHCHPWSFVSLVLWNGYYDEEWGYDGAPLAVRAVHARRAGSLCFRPAEHIHRAHLLDRTKRTWTVVVSGPRRRSWFFHTAKGMIPWKSYLLDPK